MFVATMTLSLVMLKPEVSRSNKCTSILQLCSTKCIKPAFTGSYVKWLFTPPRPSSLISKSMFSFFFSLQLARETKTILNANDPNKISEVGSPLPVNYRTH